MKNQPDKIRVRVKNGESSQQEKGQEGVFEITEDDFSSDIFPQEEASGSAEDGSSEDGLQT